MKRDREWYENTATHDYMLTYYSGEYKRRNDALIALMLPFISENSNVLDIAAGSSYIAEELLKLDNLIAKYTWNDFNQVAIDVVTTRISDDRFEINGFDAEDPSIDFNQFNVMICLSLEHIEKDIELIQRLSPGTLVAICSPNFDAKSHVRFFKSCLEFEKRYRPYINIKASATLNKIKVLTKNPNIELKKFIICGIKK